MRRQGRRIRRIRRLLLLSKERVRRHHQRAANRCRHGAVGHKRLIAQRIRRLLVGGQLIVRRMGLRRRLTGGRGGLGGGDGRHGRGLLLQLGDRRGGAVGGIVVRIPSLVLVGHGRGVRRLRLGDPRRRRSCCRRAAATTSAEVVLHHGQRTALIVEGEVLVRERVGCLPGGHGCVGLWVWSGDYCDELLCHKKR